jgi:hypothetical protein
MKSDKKTNFLIRYLIFLDRDEPTFHLKSLPTFLLDPTSKLIPPAPFDPFSSRPIQLFQSRTTLTFRNPHKNWSSCTGFCDHQNLFLGTQIAEFTLSALLDEERIRSNLRR